MPEEDTTKRDGTVIPVNTLTLWCQNFILHFSTPVFKMWIIQEANKVALWNKRHFEEKETEIMQHV
jgi:hypothetical protein